MAKKIRSLVALVAAPLVLAAGSAHAAYGGTCGAEFTALDDAIRNATTFKAEMDRTNLLGKVSSAVTKVAYDKIDDAVVILDAVSDKASSLASAAKPKLGAGDATNIMNGAYATIMCLNPNYIP